MAPKLKKARKMAEEVAAAGAIPAELVACEKCKQKFTRKSVMLCLICSDHMCRPCGQFEPCEECGKRTYCSSCLDDNTCSVCKTRRVGPCCQLRCWRCESQMCKSCEMGKGLGSLCWFCGDLSSSSDDSCTNSSDSEESMEQSTE